jgi:hypothetical protein
VNYSLSAGDEWSGGGAWTYLKGATRILKKSWEVRGGGNIVI